MGQRIGEILTVVISILLLLFLYDYAMFRAEIKVRAKVDQIEKVVNSQGEFLIKKFPNEVTK